MILDKIFISKFLFILYLLIGFCPYFGSVDLIGSQWLYLSTVNFFSLLYFYRFYTYLNFNKVLSFLIIAFLTLSIISFSKAINLAESLIEESRLFTSFFALFCIYNLSLININFKNWILNAVTSALLLEVLFFFFMFFVFSDKRGIAGNINVTSMSIIIKIPFVVYLLYINSRKVIPLILLTISFIAVFINGSRTSFIGVLLILFFSFFFSFKKKTSFFLYPFFSSLFSFLLVFIFNNKLSSRSSVINFTVSDTSTNERLLYYKEAFDTFIKNPFSGIGLGNWKLFSIDTHSALIKSYVVPYHVHNDFLQILVETGFISFFIFCSFFLFFFFMIFKLYQMGQLKSNGFLYFVSLSIGLYILDSLLNFPFARPVMVTYLMVFFAIVLNSMKGFTLNKTIDIKRYYLLLILPLVLITATSNYKVFKSFRAQKYLIEDFQSQSFDTELSYVESISSSYPNIIATTLPIDALKANYYSENIDTTLTLLNRAMNANPFIKYPEFLKSIQLKKLNRIDSSYYYARDAFNTIPLNEYHAVNFLQSLTPLKDSVEMVRVFNETKILKSKAIIYNFLKERSQFDFQINDPFYIDILESNKDILGDELYKPLLLIYTYGKDQIKRVNNLNEEADALVQRSHFQSAALIYLDLYDLIPDVAYLENAGNCYYQANFNNKASEIFLDIINNNKSQTGKSQFLYGLMMYETGNPKLGCKFLLESQKMGHPKAEKTLNLLCSK